MNVRKELARRIKVQLENTAYKEYSETDIIKAIRVLEGRMMRTMISGESFGFKKVMSIYPDPGSISARKIMKKIKHRNQMRRLKFAKRKKKAYFGIRLNE